MADPVNFKKPKLDHSNYYLSNLKEKSEQKNHREYFCHANTAIWLKLIRTPSDFDNDDIVFHPKFTHQLFDKEIIKGFKNLRVNIYFSQASLATFFQITYEDKLDDSFSADELEKKITKNIVGGFYKDKAEFLKALSRENNFKPIGKVIERHKRLSELETDPEHPCFSSYLPAFYGADTEISYKITLSTFKTPGFKSFHDRIQFFLLLFIDASSYIDSSDSIWNVLCLYERRQNRRGDGSAGPAYTFIGYCTLYSFFSYPDSSKLRISQILILPPFQRSGHGGHLLEVIGELCRKGDYSELNIEDPSDGFQFLRDLMDVSNCHRRNYFSFLSEENFREDLDEKLAARIKRELKITDVQIRRCFEILKLKFLDIKNEQQYKLFRLFVKKRIYKIFWEEILSSLIF
ncbi:histone acetyltransferase 1 [Bonamia ostreae]|uniref:Histone acetyltransferase type B catalytic subunit n=1 Tax=Bonamia ostreae TaxID=126728 RepID=A0ABV2AK40_9EUKA